MEKTLRAVRQLIKKNKLSHKISSVVITIKNIQKLYSQIYKNYIHINKVLMAQKLSW